MVGWPYKDEVFEEDDFLDYYELPVRPEQQFPQQFLVNIDGRGYIFRWRYIEAAFDSPETTFDPVLHLRIIRTLDTRVMFNGILHAPSGHSVPQPISKIGWGYMYAKETEKDSVVIYMMTVTLWLNILAERGLLSNS